jgi:formate C-acetyltransferase
MDESILKKAVSMIRGGHSSICLINDEAVFKGYERIGIPREDSQHYVISGCYEPIIMGMEEAEICAMRFNTVKCVEFALNGGKDIMTGTQVGYDSPLDIRSFDEFFDIFLKQLDYCTDFGLDFIEKQGRYSTQMNPSPIYSASFPECIEKGLDVHEYPLKYNNLSLKHHGLATTVDSLFAIKKYVYDQKEILLDDMRYALSCDWQGYEKLQTRIIKDKEKYGNNIDAPDRIMTDILEHLADRYCGRNLERGGKVRLGLDSVYHCIKHGEKTSATPNGRNEKTPLSKNLCATDGMDRGGITAYMQSVLKIDSSSFVDGVPFDFILHPSAVEGEKGLEDFISLVKIFLACGGFAMQGNVISGDVLKEAQQSPEKYATLQVRVCGWNEYFVKLSKVKQDMFIKQCEVSG